MPQLMGDAEPLKTFAGDVRGIEDSENIAMPKQHAGHTVGSVWLGSDLDIAAGGDGEGVDRQGRDSFFSQERLGLLLGHPQSKRLIRRLDHLRFAALRSASI